MEKKHALSESTTGTHVPILVRPIEIDVIVLS